MVSSVLNPEKIVRRPTATKSAAQNFISGGSVLGSSVVKSAANKIVGFQRAGVRPAAPAVDNIVSTISTNINNNITTTINKTLQGFSADYQKRIKQVDDAKPIGILGKFLNVYKTAIGFINFFGNKRNINRLGKNLEALRNSFTESFEVAKLIRQVIIKIVKQLSNLPVATPSGGGGLNVDVDIPGGGLKRSAPKGIRRMFGGGKGKMLALGAGALGLGAVGAGAVNALSDTDSLKPQTDQGGLSGDIISSLGSILEKFNSTLATLLGGVKQSKPSSKGGGGGKTSSKTSGGGGGGGAPPGPGEPTQLIQGDAPAEIKSLMETIAGPESGGNYEKMNTGGRGTQSLPGATKMTIAEVAKKATGAVGKYQEMPEYLVEKAKNAGLDPNKDLYTPENQDKIARTEIVSGLGGNEAKVVEMLKKDPLSTAKRLKNIWPSLPTGTQQLLTEQQFLQNYQKNLKTYQSLPVALGLPSPAQPGVGGPDLPDFMLPPEKRQQYQNMAQQVAQPPPSQQNQQPIFMPIDLSGGMQQQQSSGGAMSAPPPSQKDGPSVPFLPASNSDNFLVLYSRMVYNIVDG